MTRVSTGADVTTTEWPCEHSPMERFVRFVVVGGLVLVAALWGATATPATSPAWLAAGAIALLGCALVLAGIWTELELGA